MRATIVASARMIVLACLPFGVTPASAVATPHATQEFAGIGAGDVTGDLRSPLITHEAGKYFTTGQLGRGTYQLDTTETTYTARFVRSDGLVLTGTAGVGCLVHPPLPPTFCTDVFLHGGRDIVSAHLVLTGQMTVHSTPDPELLSGSKFFTIDGTVQLARRVGYVMVETNGTVHTFGGVDPHGNAPTGFVTHVETTPSHLGYWIVNRAGRVFAFGDARELGNADTTKLARGEIIVSMSSTPSGHGYWLFTNKGRVVPFGDAKFLGDMHAVQLNGPVLGAIATPTGHGYYLVARDGGVFGFGDAKFRGSMTKAKLNRPVIALVPTPDNSGCWLVAADGGTFAFSTSPNLGGLATVKLAGPIVSAAAVG